MRFTLFFESTTLAGAFSGLLASAMARWTIYKATEAGAGSSSSKAQLLCLLVSYSSSHFQTFPEQSTWLAEEERVYIKARLEADQGPNAADRTVTFGDVLTVMKDYKIWLGGLMYFGLIVPAYGYAFFAPTIISTYNYSPIETQLHSVPLGFAPLASP